MSAVTENAEKDSFQNHNTYAVSLIIPCFNVPEEQIRRVLNSLQRQTFRDFEVIIIDDGSRVEYSEIVDRLCNGLENTTLIRTENRGVSAARNTGVRSARGRYITFVDADDMVADDFLERAWMAVSVTRADFIIGGTTLIDRTKDRLVFSRAPSLPFKEYRKEELSQLVPSLIGLSSQIRFPDGYIGRGPWARLVSTELARKTPFNEQISIHEDVVWNLQIVHHADLTCIVQEPWYGYWINPDSVSRSPSPVFVEENRKGLEEIARHIDLLDDRVYTAFCDFISEVRQRCWRFYLSEARRSDHRAYRAAKKDLYTKEPWRELGRLRYMRSVGVKKKASALLYRMHLYFGVKALREHAMNQHFTVNTVRDGGN